MNKRFNICSPKSSCVAVFCAAAAILVSVAGAATIRATLQPPAGRKPAPAFRLKNSAGTTVPLSDYRGRVVLLDFWATECGGCKLEIPWFQEFDKTYRKQGLAVVGVSMDILYEGLKGPDEAWSRVNPFVKTTKLEYPILMGDKVATHAYHIEALPATYLIDKQGRVAATYVGLVDRENLDANIKSLLAEPAP